MSKAFDRISWNFLITVLDKFGFNNTFQTLIQNLLHSSHFTILINGHHTKAFKPKRGLKQGDPLSPLLFILASEAFSRTIKKETASGSLSPYYLGMHYTPITHLAFADDLILFTKGDSPTVTRIKMLLSDYEDCSGQQINRGKCSFYIPKKTPLATQSRIQTILGMNKGSLPFKYLGIQIHHGINRKPYCHDILNLFDSKLKGWYHKLLSQSGRLTLIKHVLNTMPTHEESSPMQ
ncbi:unnamed protein product [Cuscuta campestris]|uniref:Reverse transcriptase domain-containing protein n=1 Tax=Cuscuta campestris TaxID=132261 RepID=A0A484MP47_9ASTE|nr:unnamed protein product [Cuscuta campestris]